MTAAPISTVASTTTPSATRLRLTRRGRVVLTTLAAIPIVAGAFAVALTGPRAAASDMASGAHFDYVTVQPGQSLWQIAESVAPSADPRDVITDMVALNQLQSVEVRPGQRIAVPARYDG